MDGRIEQDLLRETADEQFEQGIGHGLNQRYLPIGSGNQRASFEDGLDSVAEGHRGLSMVSPLSRIANHRRSSGSPTHW